MNNWHNEYMAEYRRQELLEENEQIQLEKKTRQSGKRQQSIYKRSMYNLANWMINTGKQLRKRYEEPVIPCSNPRSKSFAG